MNRPNRLRTHRRTGVAMLVTLLVLLIVLIGIGAIMRWVSIGRDLDRIHRHQLQANCLADSGIERARQMIHVDAEFAGDTWTRGEPLLRPGNVTTAVVRDGDLVSIESVALYPSDANVPRRAVRRWRQSVSNIESNN
ncbi:hypothetical protein ACFL2H_04610 [Planctomycetota bacterium]